MPQLTAATLRKAIANVPDDTPVYFRRVAPFCGNIEEAGAANLDQIAAFGLLYPCVIVEPVAE